MNILLIVVIVVVVIVLVWLVLAFNALIRLRNEVQQGEASIDVQWLRGVEGTPTAGGTVAMVMLLVVAAAYVFINLAIDLLYTLLAAPLLLAAVGPKTLALGGRFFDGVILHPFLTPDAVRRSGVRATVPRWVSITAAAGGTPRPPPRGPGAASEERRPSAVRMRRRPRPTCGAWRPRPR